MGQIGILPKRVSTNVRFWTPPAVVMLIKGLASPKPLTKLKWFWNDSGHLQRQSSFNKRGQYELRFPLPFVAHTSPRSALERCTATRYSSAQSPLGVGSRLGQERRKLNFRHNCALTCHACKSSHSGVGKGWTGIHLGPLMNEKS